MQQYKNYLLSRHLVNEKRAKFYIYWVNKFYNHYDKQPGDEVSDNEINQYLNYLSGNREDWQVKQAKEAIQLYLFYFKQKNKKEVLKNQNSNVAWKEVAGDMQKILRLKHHAYRTEQAYMGWLRGFSNFMNGQAPHTLESSHVKDFMNYLAVERRVSASTQNQAFNAILFLFRHILGKDIEGISDAVRAKRKSRIPVVLTKSEIERLFEKLSGVNLLMARVIYGGGLRLRECLNLRIKDIDFERGALIILNGKWDKDRETVLPESIKTNLYEQLEEAKKIFQKE